MSFEPTHILIRTDGTYEEVEIVKDAVKPMVSRIEGTIDYGTCVRQASGRSLWAPSMFVERIGTESADIYMKARKTHTPKEPVKTSLLPQLATYQTTSKDTAEHNNKPFRLLGRVDPDSYDYDEVGPMYRIRIEGGSIVDAFPEEVFDYTPKPEATDDTTQ